MKAPTATSDRVCAAVSTCGTAQLVYFAPTLTSDIVCVDQQLYDGSLYNKGGPYTVVSGDLVIGITLTSLVMPVTYIGGYFGTNCVTLTYLNFPLLTAIAQAFSVTATAITMLVLPKLTSVGTYFVVSSNIYLQLASFPALQQVLASGCSGCQFSFSSNPTLTLASLPALATIGAGIVFYVYSNAASFQVPSIFTFFSHGHYCCLMNGTAGPCSGAVLC